MLTVHIIHSILLVGNLQIKTDVLNYHGVQLQQKTRFDYRQRLFSVSQTVVQVSHTHLFHDLLLCSYLYHCVCSVITAHNLTPDKRDNNYSPHPLTPTLCLL